METELYLQTAYYYRTGNVVKKDIELAIGLYKEILKSEPNNDRALYGLWWCLYDEENPKKNIDTWLPAIKKAAKHGHADSQHALGDYYAEVEKNYRKASKWLAKAADQGCVDAMGLYAVLTFWDKDAKMTNYRQALKYLHKAYELKAEFAAEELGCVYYGFEKAFIRNYRKAFPFLKEAAIAGSGRAAFRLAQAYQYGKGVKADIYEAISWYQYASELGDKDAILALGSIYEYAKDSNLNTRVDPDTILRQAEKASDYSALFCHSMMLFYENGTYGKIDYSKADYYCAKYSKVLSKTKENIDPEAAKSHLKNIRELRNMSYAATVTIWANTPDNDIAGKKELIKEFEKNIDENSDLMSLKTLVRILIGENGIKRYDSIEEPIINSIPEVVDIKRAFDLLDKGIAWGDKGCEELLKFYVHA